MSFQLIWVQAKFDSMKKQLESQEMEVMEARLMKTSELNGELDDDDDDAGTNTQTYFTSTLSKRYICTFLC